MRELHFSDDANDSLVEIALWIASESQSREIALRFTEKLRDRCVHLASLPGLLGTARPELRSDLRSTPCQGYMIYFRYRDDELEIVNILQSSRDVQSQFDERDAGADFEGLRQFFTHPEDEMPN